MLQRRSPLPAPVLFCLVLLLLAAHRAGASSPPARDKGITNSIGMEFALIPAGSFIMGSDAFDDERPPHEVRIAKPFYLGRYEVTQEQWEAVMEGNPSWFRGRTRPVEQLFWTDAQEFIMRLNRKEGHDRYRLPTEAEWEYAAGAGNGVACPDGDPARPDRCAWYGGNSGYETHPVGEKEPNAWGLYDMQGNVWEWVQDWYAGNYYAGSPSVDPPGPSSGTLRAKRGGSWSDTAEECRPARRSYDAPDDSACGSPGCRIGDLGFRLALSVEE
ncbi:MAG: formylglycine-generating enzyme family protein [Desulfovibrio sp.]|jgi:formylglycine-generating enzyme required for sulfatase activity|nr:formylglycine-generating enzyme family protein [Desulfovibrio sp.]